MWRHFPSLRFRLAAINFAVTVTILSGACGAVLVARSRELHRDLDDRLAERAASVAEDYVREPTNVPAEVLSPTHFWSGYLVQIRDTGGQTVFRSEDLGDGELPLIGRQRPGRSGSGCAWATITATDAGAVPGASGEIRVCTLEAKDQRGRPMFIQVARSLETVEKTVHDLRDTMLMVVALGLVVAALASWFVTGRTLAPLRAIARKADRLSISTLGERLGGSGRDEVSAMAASLDAMLERLRASFQAQERFISDVSHELKTPLSVLLGQAQVLARQTRTAEEYERFVTAVQDEVRSLSRTVESLLTLAKAEAGLPPASKSPVSVNEAVMDAVSRCAPLADQREVRLAPNLAMPNEQQGEPVVEGDGEMLSLMVSNLIRNAIRYAPPDTTVDVQVTAGDGQVEISVRDRGPGIPEAYIGRVFDRFFQIPKDSEAFKGAGLGLTISRGVAELHGGTVTASNHREGGCEFRVRLPLITGPRTGR